MEEVVRTREIPRASCNVKGMGLRLVGVVRDVM